MPPLPRLAKPRSLDDLLLYRMARVLGTAGTPVIRLCEGRFGITRREWAVLALLADGQDTSPSALAERAQLDRARTSRAISSLVAKGLVLRAIRPGDRRQVSLALSAAGRSLHGAMFPLVVELNHQLLAALDVAVVHQLDAALDQLQARAEALAVAGTDQPKADRRKGGRRPAAAA